MEMPTPKILDQADLEVRTVSILGSTGSIGCNTLDLIAHHPEQFSVTALTANRNVKLLAEQARIYRPNLAVVGVGGFGIVG